MSTRPSGASYCRTYAVFHNQVRIGKIEITPDWKYSTQDPHTGLRRTPLGSPVFIQHNSRFPHRHRSVRPRAQIRMVAPDTPDNRSRPVRRTLGDPGDFPV